MIGNVMVIDDDPSVLFTVRAVLERQGLEVTTADGGGNCLRALDSGFRGLLLMDVMMPGLDGWDTIRAMRDQNLMDGNVICMLTALDNPDESTEDVKEYVVDYLRKPFLPEELVSRVGECLTYLS